MRIIWKDSNKPKEYEPIKYRGCYVFGTPNGWEINIKGDDNIYRTNYSALNAIDLYRDGVVGLRGSDKRKSYGIEIVGQKNKSG